jgi:hypothetical protein
MFIVYEHWRPGAEMPFYVGKTKEGAQRATDPRRVHNRRHEFIFQKLRREGQKIIIKIVESNLMEESAFAFEKMKIAYWRAVGADLVNTSDGGEGATGYQHTDEAKARIKENNPGNLPEVRTARAERWRENNPMHDPDVVEKIRTAVSGDNNHMKRPEMREKARARMKGSKRPPEAVAKFKETMRGRPNPMHNPETRAKVSAALTGRPGPLLGKTLPPEWRENIKRGWEKRRAAKLAKESENVAQL